VITAPISGTISGITAQIGSYVDISSPVATVIDNGSIHLDLQVFEKDLPK
jgi:multidrug resistance efflux pump